jgi:hypothetical protein
VYCRFDAIRDRYERAIVLVSAARQRTDAIETALDAEDIARW